MVLLFYKTNTKNIKNMKTYNFRILEVKNKKYEYMENQIFVNCEISKKAMERFKENFVLGDLTEFEITEFRRLYLIDCFGKYENIPTK